MSVPYLPLNPTEMERHLLSLSWSMCPQWLVLMLPYLLSLTRLLGTDLHLGWGLLFSGLAELVEPMPGLGGCQRRRNTDLSWRVTLDMSP